MDHNSLLHMVVVVHGVLLVVHEALADRDVVGRDGILEVLPVVACLQQFQMFRVLYSSWLPIHK